MTDADAIKLAEGVSVITPDRLQSICNAVRATAHLAGEMAELGVHRGGSARVISAVCPQKKLHLFDTFSGFPCDEEQQYDPDRYLVKGGFAADEQEVRRFLEGCNVEFHVGLFPDSLPRNLINYVENLSFVHVDCDLYDSALAAIEWLWGDLVTGGIMLFDDYNCKFTGVTQAVNECFASEQIVAFQYGEYKIGCMVRK